MKYSQFLRRNKNRDRYVLLGFLLPLGCIVLVLVLAVLTTEPESPARSVLLFLGLALGIAPSLVVSVLFFCKAYRIKNYSGKLFREEEFILSWEEFPDPNPTELVALEQFEGDLKKALHYILQTPDLSRRQRLVYFRDWHDFEVEYLWGIYKKPMHRVATVSLRETLPYCEEGYEEAVCSGKFSNSTEDSTDYFLKFGSYGDWAVPYRDSELYNLTAPGDLFYLALSSDGKRIRSAYSALDYLPPGENEDTMS